jgi:hypothetical protein
MRTTLAIDDDVLVKAKSLADRQRKTVGEIISALARKGLSSDLVEPPRVRNGLPLLRRQPGSQPVTLEIVNKLRDEEL